MKLNRKMSRSPRFTIRDLLVLTAVVALACVPLVIPSVWWLFLLPPLACIVCVWGIYRMAPPGANIFWVCVLLGMLVYGAAVQFSAIICYFRQMQGDVWTSYIGVHAWAFIHGEHPFFKNPDSYRSEDIVSFTVWMHVVFSLLISAAAAFVCQLLDRRLEPDSGK